MLNLFLLVVILVTSPGDTRLVSLTRRRNLRFVSLKVSKSDFESFPYESIRYMVGNEVLGLD